MSIRSESEFWILSSLAEGRRHGYGIMQDVAASSEGRTRLKAPTLYAALERLENDGCIRPGGEEIVDGRARRYYELTDTGAAALDDEATRLAERAQVAQRRLRQRAGAIRTAPTTARVALA